MEKINKGSNITWIFFDELNTCSSLPLLSEIFIKKTFNGTKLKKDITIIGACNPYKKREENKIICGLTYPNDESDLIYDVNILPQSLMYYVFNFSSIDSEDEKKYISSIIYDLFPKEKELLEKTTDAISECHIYLRKKFGSSVVSLREMRRFKIFYKFFCEEYYPKKNMLLIEKENKENKKN